MFGNMFGDMEERQKEMREKLAQIEVEASSSDGAITIRANANREILNVSIDQDKLDLQDAEQLEDLLVVTTNEVLRRAQEQEAAAAKDMIKDMLPPGMDGLSGLFS